MTKCYIMMYPRANSDEHFTHKLLYNVFFLAVGVIKGELQQSATALCCDFSKDLEQNTHNHLLVWLMMLLGITTIFKPLDLLVNKVDNMYFRDLLRENK